MRVVKCVVIMICMNKICNKRKTTEWPVIDCQLSNVNAKLKPLCSHKCMVFFYCQRNIFHSKGSNNYFLLVIFTRRNLFFLTFQIKDISLAVKNPPYKCELWLVLSIIWVNILIVTQLMLLLFNRRLFIIFSDCYWRNTTLTYFLFIIFKR